MTRRISQSIIDLYDAYTHGAMARREFMKCLAKAAGGAAAAQAIMPLLANDYARAAIIAEDDPRLAVSSESFETGDIVDLSDPSSFTGDIGHASAEDSIDADHHAVAGFDEIGDAGFHPGTAGAADRHCEWVHGPKDLPEHRLRLIHHLQEVRVEMPHSGGGHRRQHARRNIAGAGAHQDAAGWCDS